MDTFSHIMIVKRIHGSFCDEWKFIITMFCVVYLRDSGPGFRFYIGTNKNNLII